MRMPAAALRVRHHLLYPLLRPLLGAVLAALVAVLTLYNTTETLDRAFYDALLTRMQQPVDERIRLVVVDERSLAELGYWPWPRSIHAELVRTLTSAGVAGIAFDILFSEPDRVHPEDDIALGEALAQSARVVSPVTAEIPHAGGMLAEVLPLPVIADASAALGHAEIPLEHDGVVRQAYLRAGLGAPRWPGLALALATLHAGDHATLPGERRPDAAASPQLWQRDYRVLVPYAQPPGFVQVSYVDVLRGDVPMELFADARVLVGVSAGGIAREVRIPDAADGSVWISGVEYHAHLLNALLQGNLIVPLTGYRQLLPGMLLVLLPLLLYRRRHWMLRPWVAALSGALATVAVSVLLMLVWRVWFAPMPTLLVGAGGYFLWLMLHLYRSQSLASHDGLTRLANRYLLDDTLEYELAAARRTRCPLTMMLLDVDHFKPYNDHYGHQAGDVLLRKIAQLLQERARRPRDLAARYGGDELVLLLPESSAGDALVIAREILDEVRRLRLPHAFSPIANHVTLSIGLATYTPGHDGRTHEVDLFRRADTALYRAKHDGRDRVCTDAPLIHG